MNTRFGYALIATVAFVLTMPSSVVATQHDPCLHLINGFLQGQDMGDAWTEANEFPHVTPLGCEGEMDFNDPDDWLYIDVPGSQDSDTISVEVCPTFVSVNPWNVNLKVFFLPLGTKLPPIAGNPLVNSIINSLPPGIPHGSSSNGPGACDSVVSVQEFAAQDGRWYVNIERMGGQGGYHLDIHP